MLETFATDQWQRAFPGAIIGLLEVAGLDNRGRSAALEAHKRAIEERLRSRYAGFSRQDFLALPVMAAYRSYYKRFDMTYHVQLQLESLVLKGKSLPDVSPLVDANFAAELETLVLTAAHDVDRLFPPLLFDVSQEGDEMLQMSGVPRRLRPGDMLMRDAKGISCTILYGQDNRSPISPSTTRALYVAYAPPGVGQEHVSAQLDAIQRSISLFAPNCSAEQRLILVK